jgi:hypothetical protein
MGLTDRRVRPASAGRTLAEGARQRRVGSHTRPLLSIPAARYGVAAATLLALIVWIT